jgi:hypothetical protein
MLVGQDMRTPTPNQTHRRIGIDHRHSMFDQEGMLPGESTEDKERHHVHKSWDKGKSNK